MTTRRAAAVLAVLAVAIAAYLAVLSAEAGIFADDAGFYKAYLTTDMLGKAQAFWGYVPGRNLHMLWQYLAFASSVWTPADFAGYHILQSLVVALNAWLVGVLLLLLRVRIILSASLMLLFVLWPTYAEAYFWQSSLPMHLASTTFVLAMLLAMTWAWRSPGRWFPIAAIVVSFLLATFTYDQAASASLFVIVVWLLAVWLRARRTGAWKQVRAKAAAVLATALMSTAFYAYLVVVVRPGASGPVVTQGIGGKILNGLGDFIVSFGLQEVNAPSADGWWLLSLTAWLLRFSLLVAVAVLAMRIWRQRQGEPELSVAGAEARTYLLLSMTAMGAAMASYGPAWAWWVALRHNYLPFMFVILAYGLAFHGALATPVSKWNKIAGVLVTGLLLATCLGSWVGLTDQASAWNDRAQLREATYNRIAQLVSRLPNGSTRCVQFLAVDATDNATPFYSEYMQAALDIYSRDPFGPSCTQPWLPEETGCQPGQFPSLTTDRTYIRFPHKPDGTRDWLGAELFARCD